jgi:hypothetical protein
MVLICTKPDPSNPECKLSRADVEESTEETEATHTITDEDAITTIMNPDPEIKPLRTNLQTNKLSQRTFPGLRLPTHIPHA